MTNFEFDIEVSSNQFVLDLKPQTFSVEKNVVEVGQSLFYVEEYQQYETTETDL